MRACGHIACLAEALPTLFFLLAADLCEQEGSVGVSMAEATFDYSWEYQGNAPKLVYTPLTDKCYLTLTQVCKNVGSNQTDTVSSMQN